MKIKKRKIIFFFIYTLNFLALLKRFIIFNVIELDDKKDLPISPHNEESDNDQKDKKTGTDDANETSWSTSSI